MIYADYAATSPLRTAAKNAIQDCLDLYGNPSSIHSAGKAAAAKIAVARKDIAERLNCRHSEVFFTSGGTEANNWVLRGCLQTTDHVITSAIEHHATLNTLKQMDCGIAYIFPMGDGIVDPCSIEKSIRNNTRLISIMTANNEIGTIQPVAEIAKIARIKKALFHTDAVQAAGHIALDMQKLGVDMLSISAHKFGGPKGIGLLYCRKRPPAHSLIYGGDQERGQRAGTENTIGIIAMAAAFCEACANMERESQHVQALRDKLVSGIRKIQGGRVFGSMDHRLPGNVSCAIGTAEGEMLTLLLDAAGVCVSAGAACSSGRSEPSHVLTALGLTTREASHVIRISLGEHNTPSEIEYILDQLNKIASQKGGAE